jgi:hypothetical protein
MTGRAGPTDRTRWSLNGYLRNKDRTRWSKRPDAPGTTGRAGPVKDRTRWSSEQRSTKQGPDALKNMTGRDSDSVR